MHSDLTLCFPLSQIAIASWNEPERLPGAGIIIFPTTSSTGLLIGAVFLNSSFPDFIVSSRPGTSAGGASGTGGGGGANQQHQPSSEPSPSSYSPNSNQPLTPPNYPTTHRHYQAQAQQQQQPQHQMGMMPFPGGQANMKMSSGVGAGGVPAIARPFSPALSQLGRHAQASVRGHPHYPTHGHPHAHHQAHHHVSVSASWPVINEDEIAENAESYQRWQ